VPVITSNIHMIGCIVQHVTWQANHMIGPARYTIISDLVV